jgi:hypothetical protein
VTSRLIEAPRGSRSGRRCQRRPAGCATLRAGWLLRGKQVTRFAASGPAIRAFNGYTRWHRVRNADGVVSPCTKGSPPMRYVLQLGILLAVLGTSAAFGADLIRLAQIVQPTPLPAPQLLPQSSTSLTCVINCDTLAMNCQNSCVVIGAVATSSPAGTAPCNLNCTTQQLVCKQNCSR